MSSSFLRTPGFISSGPMDLHTHSCSLNGLAPDLPQWAVLLAADVPANLRGLGFLKTSFTVKSWEREGFKYLSILKVSFSSWIVFSVVFICCGDICKNPSSFPFPPDTRKYLFSMNILKQILWRGSLHHWKFSRQSKNLSNLVWPFSWWCFNHKVELCDLWRLLPTWIMQWFYVSDDLTYLLLFIYSKKYYRSKTVKLYNVPILGNCPIKNDSPSQKTEPDNSQSDLSKVCSLILSATI